jgi:hypothetical protein
MTIWYILCLFAMFLPGFGTMYQEKSGNPANGSRGFRGQLLKTLS